MRAGGNCSSVVQQTLTSEAVSVLKHSLSLARRRGHAQVTPLHVAATLLGSRFSLLKRACLKSHESQLNHNHIHQFSSSSSSSSSYPLQCRALELCFNVALNRLPTTPASLLHGQPSLSNALIAALKRAQANQRRGCIEQQHQHQHQYQQQNQHVLAVKVELEQLIVSILDDPSVSRVMREAGFSSIDVKTSLDDCLNSSVFQCYTTSGGAAAGGIYSTPNSPPTGSSRSFWNSDYTSQQMQNPLIFLPQKKLLTGFTPSCAAVVEVLQRKKKRNAVIVGDSLSITESLIAELKSKIEKGDVPEELKSAHFIRFEFCSSSPLKLMNREEVEVNISGLKSKVDNLIAGGIRGVIIYIGDLKWAVEEDEDLFKTNKNKNNPVDDLVAGIGKLVSCYCNMKVWIMASANHQTYMKCQMMIKPNLHIQWGLQAVHVPSNGLGLTLNAPRYESMNNKNPINYEREQSMLTCAEYHGNKSTPWPAYSRIPESQTISCIGSNFKPTQNPNSHSVPRFRRQQSCHIEFDFSNGTTPHEIPNLDYLKGCEDKEDNITLALGSNSLISGSGISSSKISAEAICKMLQEIVPWQWEKSVASIVPVLMESRSSKKDTWLLIKGNDNVGKKRLALAIADVILGSSDLLHDIRNIEMLENALRQHERLVLFVENVHLADPEFLKFLADVCRRSKSRTSDVRSCELIFVLTTSFDSDFVNEITLRVNETAWIDSGSRSLSSDNKRKSQWDCCIDDGKSTRKDGMEYVTRQFSSNVLDLNVKADEDENEDKQDEINVVPHNHVIRFLEMIKNQFVFNRDSTDHNQM